MTYEVVVCLLAMDVLWTDSLFPFSLIFFTHNSFNVSDSEFWWIICGRYDFANSVPTIRVTFEKS